MAYKIKRQRLTIEPTFVPRGSGNNSRGGKQDLHYKIKEWGYVFPNRKDALKYAKTHIEKRDSDIYGQIIEKKNPKLWKEIVSEKPKNIAWNVSLNRKRIDTVFYNADISKEDVKKSLIDHDGYDSGIKLNKSRRLK